MLGFVVSAASSFLVLLGLLSALLFASALAYALDGLRRRRRYGLMLVTALLFVGAFTAAGVWVVSVLAGVVVLVQASCYLYFAARTLSRKRAPAIELREPWPSVSIVVAARDEAAVITDTLRSLDALDYPAERLEVIVIDDGSSDGTFGLAKAVADSARHRMRIRHYLSSGGKARRLNEALADMTSELVLFLDADHQVDSQLVKRMAGLLEGRPSVACVQVASSARNADQNLLTKLLEMEYLFRCHALYTGKGVAMFVGSGGMVRREALQQIQGFHTEMLTEDVEMSYRLYRAGHDIIYEDSLVTRDLAADTGKSFFLQRLRWMRGLWQAMALHRRETERHVPLARVRAYYVQFCLDGFGALCLCVLMMYFALFKANLVAFPATWVILYMLTSCAAAFSLGAVRGGQPSKLLLLPLVPVYIVAHTVPMTWALIDSFLLRRPLQWVKTERVMRADAELSESRGSV